MFFIVTFVVFKKTFDRIIKLLVSYLNQKTIKNQVSFSGIGLHTGLNVNVSIKSALPDTGIIFKRVDLKKNNIVYPNFFNVSSTSLNTTITN